MILNIRNHGQKIWHQGKVVWFYCSLVLAPVCIVLGLISLLGLVEINPVKCLIGGLIFLVIAYALKGQKDENT